MCLLPPRDVVAAAPPDGLSTVCDGVLLSGRIVSRESTTLPYDVFLDAPTHVGVERADGTLTVYTRRALDNARIDSGHRPVLWYCMDTPRPPPSCLGVELETSTRGLVKRVHRTTTPVARAELTECPTTASADVEELDVGSAMFRPTLGKGPRSGEGVRSRGVCCLTTLVVAGVGRPLGMVTNVTSGWASDSVSMLLGMQLGVERTPIHPPDDAGERWHLLRDGSALEWQRLQPPATFVTSFTGTRGVCGGPFSVTTDADGAFVVSTGTPHVPSGTLLYEGNPSTTQTLGAFPRFLPLLPPFSRLCCLHGSTPFSVCLHCIPSSHFVCALSSGAAPVRDARGCGGICRWCTRGVECERDGRGV